MEAYVDEKPRSLGGVGLVFLLSRQLMYGSKIRTGHLLIDPVAFSISVLLVLYTATIIGIAVEIVFFRNRGSGVRMTFRRNGRYLQSRCVPIQQEYGFTEDNTIDATLSLA